MPALFRALLLFSATALPLAAQSGHDSTAAKRDTVRRRPPVQLNDITVVGGGTMT